MVHQLVNHLAMTQMFQDNWSCLSIALAQAETGPLPLLKNQQGGRPSRLQKKNIIVWSPHQDCEYAPVMISQCNWDVCSLLNVGRIGG
jgi:hypothetical protein